MLTLAADRGDAGRRLDLVLRRHLAGVRGATRTQVQGWIEDGQVCVNGKPVLRAAARTAAGDVVTVQGLGPGTDGPTPPEPGAWSLEPRAASRETLSTRLQGGECGIAAGGRLLDLEIGHDSRYH